MIIDDYCRKVGCQNLIDWAFQFDDEEQPYPCTSCMQQGQSYNVLRLSKNCPFKSEIARYIRNDKNDNP